MMRNRKHADDGTVAAYRSSRDFLKYYDLLLSIAEVGEHNHAFGSFRS